ncbi:hypothetical protein [Cohaesibacter celericrescens]|nr:hypothetical protein [Cohaesibacter celericrescens]
MDSSDQPSAAAQVEHPVPRIKTYSKVFVDQLIFELDQSPAGSAVRVVTADLYTLRRQVCAINDSQTACQLMRQ